MLTEKARLFNKIRKKFNINIERWCEKLDKFPKRKKYIINNCTI
jgi:hypothetical protein